MKKVFEMSQEEKIEYMTTEKVGKLVNRMALPTILSMLVSSFYNMADSFFVGKIDNESSAAVGIVFSVMNIIQAFGFFFGQGSGNYMSRQLGKKEVKSAGTMAVCGFVYAFISGILIMVLGLLFTRPFAIFLGAIESVLPTTISYLRIILIGAPFVTISCVMNNQLRFQGSAMYSMIGIVSGAVLNVILDPLFIFGFDMGIKGAAIATVCSQAISALLLWAGTRRKGNIAIEFKKFSPSFFYLKEIARGGFPSLIRQGFASVATICLNHAAGMYEAAAIAAMGIVSRIQMFANAAIIGFGQGFQPVAGMNYGAQKYDRVKKAYYFCVKYAFCFLLVVATLLFIFARPIAALFRDDETVIDIAARALRMQCISFPLNAVIVNSNMMLQSCGKAVRASILAMSRQGLFFIPLILILPKFIGLTGIEMTQMLSDFCTFIVTLFIVTPFLRFLQSQSRQDVQSKKIK